MATKVGAGKCAVNRVRIPMDAGTNATEGKARQRSEGITRPFVASAEYPPNAAPEGNQASMKGVAVDTSVPADAKDTGSPCETRPIVANTSMHTESPVASTAARASWESGLSPEEDLPPMPPPCSTRTTLMLLLLLLLSLPVGSPGSPEEEDARRL